MTIATGYHQTGGGATITYSESGTFHVISATDYSQRSLPVKIDGIGQLAKYHTDTERIFLTPVQLLLWFQPELWQGATPGTDLLTITQPIVDGFDTPFIQSGEADPIGIQYPRLALNLGMVALLTYQYRQLPTITLATPTPAPPP